MSFSGDVKTEICRQLPAKKCCAVAQAYGVLLYCNTFTQRGIRVVTESRAFAGLLPKLFRKAFSVNFDAAPEDGDRPGKLSFSITDPEKLQKIFSTYGYDAGTLLAHHVNLGVLEEDCCRVSFVRGAFLAGGSVTDPMKRYHLEMVTDHYSVSREALSLLLEMGFEPKETSRGGNYIIYFKQSEAIADLLTCIGAPVAAMDIMSAKIEKEMTNSVNRRVNCDTANVTKTVDAAQRQLLAIRRIDGAMGLGGLPEKLRETAALRLENPELSISELAAAASPPVSKSCLSHRLRKLESIAEELQVSAIRENNKRISGI